MLAPTSVRSRLVDQYGRAFASRLSPQSLGELLPARQVRARYDAAQTTDEFRNYWGAADSLSADAANSRPVREKLVARSRYEVANNGYVDGIVQTWATDCVGVGPRLRMQTSSDNFNRLVENTWDAWARATQFRRKLWTMAHSKVVDGEGLMLLVNNEGLRHDIKLFPLLVETEQCRSPWLATGETGRVDGIDFDDLGNPSQYWITPDHPGGPSWVQRDPIPVPAERVLHWFTMRRPGQHRGIPDLTSTLNVGAASRRFREATVAAAETAADFAAVLETDQDPEIHPPVAPFTSQDIRKRVMTSLPYRWKLNQLAAEHPNASYADFIRQQISESARPLSMPYNKAACDSSTYNYSSGRLDHQTYYASLDVARADATDVVLQPLFDLWVREAALAFGWFQGEPLNRTPPHLWDWPPHPTADAVSEATANDKRLRNGTLTLRSMYAQQGLDFDDEIETLATDYSVTPDEMRAILRTAIFNDRSQQSNQQQADQQASQSQREGDAT